MYGYNRENKEIVIIGSPITLVVGGWAKLTKLFLFHNVAIRGNTICTPRAMIIVRLWMRS